jgi:anti-sigma-K factor RskA
MSPELHSLTGAYAVDAMTETERQDFESHLPACWMCTVEVREFQATAAWLAEAVSQPPPEELKLRVLASIDQVRQVPPLTPPESARPQRWGWARPVLAVAAAVLLVATAGLGVFTARLQDRVEEMQAMRDQVASVLAAPDVLTVNERLPSGGSATVVASADRGEALFVVSGLPPAPDGRTYQLWLIGPDGPRSSGLFDVGADGDVVRALSGDVRGSKALGLTVEPAGGSPRPTTELLVQLTLKK